MKCKTLSSLIFILFVIFFCSCKEFVNSIEHDSFDKDGHYIDTLFVFKSSEPKNIKFYVEVSGSMNGFFRGNRPTSFKNNVWSVFSNFTDLIDEVYTFDNVAASPSKLSLNDFRSKMNSGRFTSTYSTEVPSMLKSVIDNLDSENGEVAVLVSDMKYSPAGNQSMLVLLDQYATDIRNLFSKNNDIAISLIAATSDYLDRNGATLCSESPYYYLLIGNPNNVVWVRNHIAMLLKENYVDVIEYGIDYQSPSYELSRGKNIIRLRNEPTYYNFDQSVNDTCIFNISLDLKEYPWDIIDEDVFRQSLKLKTTEGSAVVVDSILFKYANNASEPLSRKTIADVSLRVYDMFTKADVIECAIQIPKDLLNKNITAFYGSTNENEYDKTFSIENFIEGCFLNRGQQYSNKPIQILISTTDKK